MKRRNISIISLSYDMNTTPFTDLSYGLAAK